jgi:hypothetical protein
MAFTLHPRSEERKRSAVSLIKLLLKAENRHEVLPEHTRELLDKLLWKLTERDGSKYKTRLQSQRALDSSAVRGLRHEHVFQKEIMINLLMAAAPDEIDGILQDAVGCTVTIEEHARLAPFDKEYGWERYRKAGIEVINAETGERVI